MEIQGKVIAVLEPQTFVSQKNGNTYVSNVFVLETQGQYPRRIAFKVMGEDKFQQMGIVVNGVYNISFDIESRLWQGRWFTDCQAWRAQRVDGVAEQPQQSPTPAPAPIPTSAPVESEDETKDGLPF